MSHTKYVYAEQRDSLFSEKGQVVFMRVRDRVKELLASGRASRMDALLEASWETHVEDWTILACLDRLVELEEIRECKYEECAGQHRVFMSARMAR